MKMYYSKCSIFYLLPIFCFMLMSAKFPEKIFLKLTPIKGSYAVYKNVQEAKSEVNVQGRTIPTPLAVIEFDTTEEIIDIDKDGIIYKCVTYSNVKGYVISGKKKRQPMEQKPDLASLEGKNLGMKLSPNGYVLEIGEIMEVTKEDIISGWRAGLKLVMDEELKKVLTSHGYFYLPDKEVKIGDTWESQYSFLGVNRREFYTLVGFENVKGYNCAVMDIVIQSTGVVQEMISSAMEIGQMKNLVTGEFTAEGKGRIYFAYEKGILVSYELSEISITKSIIMGMEQETKSETKQTIKLTEFRNLRR